MRRDALRLGRPPSPVTPMHGRSEDLARLMAMLGSPSDRLVTLTGAGGVGKTRLAIEAAERVRGDGRTRAWFVGLDLVGGVPEMLPAIAAAVGVRARSSEHLFDDLCVRLSQLPTLLVVDTVEHLSAAAPVLSSLAEACPTLWILATSVMPLRVRRERVLGLCPLPVPEPGAADIDVLERQPAVAMFVDRASRADSVFALTADNAAAVGSVCRELRGLPLAIELAAARVRFLPPCALLRRLAGPGALDVLAGGALDAPERQRGMRSAIDWTYRLLRDRERRLLRRMSTAEGAFTLDFVTAMAAASPARADVLGALATLTDARLVECAPPPRTVPGQAWYVLPPLVRWFARQRLAESGEAPSAHRAHARWFESFAASVGAVAGEATDMRAVGAVAAVEADVRTAATWLWDNGEAAAALTIFVAAAPLAETRGYDSVCGVIAEALVAAAEGGPAEVAPPVLRAQALAWSAHLALSRAAPTGKPSAAAASIAAAVVRARDTGDVRALLPSLSFAVRALPLTRDATAAAAAAHEGLALAAAAGREDWLARFEAWAGRLHLHEGDAAAAARLGWSALWRARRRGDQRGIVLAASLLWALPENQMPCPGLPELTELLETCREAGDEQAESWVLAALAGADEAAGDLESAARWSAQRLALLRGGWAPAHYLDSLMVLAIAAVTAGELATAAWLHGFIVPLLSGVTGAVAPSRVSAYQTAVGVLRDRLGERAFQSAADAGALAVGEAVADGALAFAARFACGDGAGGEKAGVAGPGEDRGAGGDDPGESADEHRVAGLTPRERQVLSLIARGEANKEIARHLSLSSKTVMHYTVAIYRKLGVRGRSAATAWALRHGIDDHVLSARVRADARANARWAFARLPGAPPHL